MKEPDSSEAHFFEYILWLWCEVEQKRRSSPEKQQHYVFVQMPKTTRVYVFPTNNL